uniref:LysR family transcriptional regulator n=1 Tax=Brucella pseudintermedia TaxID=370111 RepID=UPI00158B2355|nr:LysR family transcriptional regulator [Brucella pseudintermedia]
MNENWAKDFLALAETLNFSRAAVRRNITQPAFGRRIRALEEWCGQQLVDRSSHRLALTPAGELMLDAASDIVRRIDRLRHDLQAEARSEMTLVFAATQALSFTFFPSWISHAGKGVAVHLLADNMQACEALMEAGKAQFLLCHLHPEMPLDIAAAHYRSHVIGGDRLVPVAAVRNGEPICSLDGVGTPYLQFDAHSGLGRILDATLSTRIAQLDLVPVFTSHVAMALKSLMLDGRGVAWLPLSLLKDELAEGRCCLLGGGLMDVEMSITLIRPTHRMTRVAEAFWTTVKQP